MKSLKEIQDYLNKAVIGQEDAVKSISTAVYKYLLKLRAKDFGVFFDSSTTLLLLGNTGVGKTYLTKILAAYLGLDFVEINAKEISQPGWYGQSLIKHLEIQLPFNSTDAIIFIDEFDKILIPNYCSGGDDVNYHIQSSLLKSIEGQAIKERKGNFNTKNCLFILAGSFTGLKTEPQKQIGYSEEKAEGMALHDALVEFGMLPEMAGRIQNTAKLRDLTERDYYSILNSDSFIYSHYKEVFKRLGIIEFCVKKELVDKALAKKLGVRGLIQEVEEYITTTMNSNLDNMRLEILNSLEVPVRPWWNPNKNGGYGGYEDSEQKK